MAAPLKDSYGPEVPARIAGMIAGVHPGFAAREFLADALDGYEALELMPRARRIADALARHLPAEPEHAMAILVASLGPPRGDPETEPRGMEPFVYLPHVLFVGERGLERFDASIAALHALTQRFTGEFGIRPFIAREPERTFAVLERWTADPSLHVRRLVSEGSRPRLPWAPRLRALMEDPSPLLPLLERLRDDPSEYVRRSVANNLNDIAKDHPALVVGVAERWLAGAPPERRRLVRHALRTLLRAGDPDALALVGAGGTDALAATGLRADPSPARIGGSVTVAAELVNEGAAPARVLAHLRVHFVRADGGTSPRTFVVRELELDPGERAAVSARVSLRQHTTRTHHPGRHRLELLANGRTVGELVVEVRPPVGRGGGERPPPDAT